MDKKILINVKDKEKIRVAILENNKLMEFYMEKLGESSIVGNIYKGKVIAINRSLNAAFVDIGFEKAGFLPLSNVMDDIPSLNTYREDIEDIIKNRKIKKNDEIIVQVVKEPLGTKGARITTFVSIPGHYAVIMPGLKGVAVSRKIRDNEERKRLKKIVRNSGFGKEELVIIRTSAANMEEFRIEEEIHLLRTQWETMLKKATNNKAPLPLYEENSLFVKLLRDHFRPDVKEVIIDEKHAYSDISLYMQYTHPDFADRVKFYEIEEEKEIFEYYGIEKEIRKMRNKHVYLKNGGYLVIDPTTALVAIDVNSGKTGVSKEQEEMIFNTNMLAAEEIVRQIRLRDMGGIIVVDFIDMRDENHKKRLFEHFRHLMKKDRSPSKILPINQFGLLELTRKRIKEGIESDFYNTCPICNGLGLVLKEEHQIDILKEWLKDNIKDWGKKSMEIRMPTHLMNALEDDVMYEIAKIGNKYGISINIKNDERLKWNEIWIIDIEDIKIKEKIILK